MSTDETREALTAAVREGEAAGMYGETTGPWTCAHCGATSEGPEPHCVQLARIINGYDRTPAEARAKAAEDALAAVADAPGLEEVLRAHWMTGESRGGILAVCTCGEAMDGYDAHLAGVVRAWLRGEER